MVMPPGRFERLFVHLEKLSSVQKGRPFINNEFNTVYLITLTPEERASMEPASFRLQESEVSRVQWVPWQAVRKMYEGGDPEIVPLR